MKLISITLFAVPVVVALSASQLADPPWPGSDLAECQEFFDQCMVHVTHGHTTVGTCNKGLGMWY